LESGAQASGILRLPSQLERGTPAPVVRGNKTRSKLEANSYSFTINSSRYVAMIFMLVALN
jgi:hypothetical protein